MPVRRRNQKLATTFVVTVSALSACTGSRENNVPPVEPVVAGTSEPEAPDPEPTPTASETPPPEEPPQPTARTWRITQEGKLCQAESGGECPPGANCNPPPPVKYECVVDLQYPATVTRAAGATQCTTTILEHYPVKSCPPPKHCNPPPPRREERVVPCPE